MLKQTAKHSRGSRVVCILILSAALAAAHASVPASAPAYGVRLENVWIPMKDGIRLAATLYVPAGAKAGERFPALLEYLPYRKDDDEAVRDFGTHTYFAKRGYVGARVDIRGFGARS
jgi:predicted acyl esterase